MFHPAGNVVQKTKLKSVSYILSIQRQIASRKSKENTAFGFATSIKIVVQKNFLKSESYILFLKTQKEAL